MSKGARGSQDKEPGGDKLGGVESRPFVREELFQSGASASQPLVYRIEKEGGRVP